MSKLARFAWAVLVLNLAVIAWGAYVRATGSGAGCGAHWPLCNGEIVPRAPSVQMLVEFSHRVSSALALVSVMALAAWVWRTAPRGHPSRRAAAGATLFMLTEAAVGAGLVLFRLVADNATMARAMFMSVHLVNTFVLLAFLTLTAYWLSGGRPVRVRDRERSFGWLLAGGLALMIVGVSGAVAALGDTLYPASSLSQGVAADVSASSHLLIRLRLLHPFIATTVALSIVVAAYRVDRSSPAGLAAAAVAFLAVLQVGAGFLNVFLLAPVPMQLAHLLVADALWIAYIIMAARMLGDAGVAVAPARV